MQSPASPSQTRPWLRWASPRSRPAPQNRRFRVAQADTREWYSARHLGEDTAAYKVLVEEGTNHVLGAHLIGPNAEEAINVFALAMRLDLNADQLRRFVPAYPSAGSDIGHMLG